MSSLQPRYQHCHNPMNVLTREQIEAETAAVLKPFEGKVITPELREEILVAVQSLINKHDPGPAIEETLEGFKTDLQLLRKAQSRLL
ncbi:MAG: hypothetical protein ABW007_19195 [Chitinophagaceae bacterium]